MTTKINKGTGAGGAMTNRTGIDFENIQYLEDFIFNKGMILVKNISTSSRSELFNIVKDGKHIGYYGRQSQFYKALELFDSKYNEKFIKSKLSKKILPDGFILDIKNKRLTIFEKKWQQSSGSVDEKIQTAPYKIAILEGLLSGSGLALTYQYILSSWFQHHQYDDLKKYYATNSKVGIWVQGENLETLNIEDFIS